ncbi:MAG: 2-dehydropantoate 2-reductase [Moraxellaceae bacterium]|nr:2-dehydropantoate 2-reductase [Moraxellaceae bacterium]
MIADPTLSHWHILGAGAIGGLWALRLHSIGCRVTLVERAPLSPERHLQLTDNSHTSCHDFPVVAANAAILPLSPLLITTKASDTLAALTPLLPRLNAGDTVLLLQNGMGIDDWLRQQRPDLQILTAITTDGVFRPTRDHLVMAGHGETLIGGDTAVEQEAALQIARQWQKTGEAVQAVADIQRRRWQKLAINCAINPLTTRYRCCNGALLDMPEALFAMQSICAEVAVVMRLEGHPASTASLFDAACAVARQTGTNTSSMLADVQAKRPTEIDFMNGHIVTMARKHGIDTPANARITAEVRALHPHPAGSN